MMSPERIGSSFESFLEDEGIRDEVDAVAQERVFAWQIQQAVQAAGIMEPAGTGCRRARSD